MTIEIQVLNQVPEAKLKAIIKSFAQDGANIVTAINDTKGTFSVEATFIDPGPQTTITISGKMSTFGGPQDMGIAPGEDVALYSPANIATAPAGLFLNSQPPNTTGLGRRLNPAFNYLACRWDYTITPKDFLRSTIITVTANGRSLSASVADWGPNLSTGRIADLSPGLAHGLGLNTDDTCTLLIPTPAGTQIPIPADAPDLAIDLRAIGAALLPKDKAQNLIVVVAMGTEVYWALNVVGSTDGGQTLLKSVARGAAKTLLSDTVVFPVQAGPDIPDVVAGELNKAIRKEPPIITGPPGTAPGSVAEARAKMFAAARGFVGHSTHDVPGTEHGALACAYAVNQCAVIGLGKAISTQGGGENGLSTIGLFDALNANHTRLGSTDVPQPGDVIIAPTEGLNHGHTGVVGNDSQIFSNSSHPGVFAQNFTIDSFKRHYEGLGLRVFFFSLNPAFF
jgi:hypothetical protein